MPPFYPRTLFSNNKLRNLNKGHCLIHNAGDRLHKFCSEKIFTRFYLTTSNYTALCYLCNFSYLLQQHVLDSWADFSLKTFFSTQSWILSQINVIYSFCQFSVQDNSYTEKSLNLLPTKLSGALLMIASLISGIMCSKV